MKKTGLLITIFAAALSLASSLQARAWDPAWSPDGSQIVFTCDYGGATNIWISDADGSNPTQLTNHSYTDWDPDWSPDGTKIIFSHDRDGDRAVFNVWTIDVAGTGLTQLTFGGSGWETEAVWSPDGAQIAYDGIWIMNADGTNQSSIASGIQPSFRGDGSRIVFSNSGNLWTADPNGANPVQVTNDVAQDWHPDFSTDGTKIAFASNRGGNDGIWTMNIDGSSLSRLADSSTSGEPQWSPDGTKIIFEGTDGNNIWIINTDGSGLTLIPTPADLSVTLAVMNVHQADDTFQTYIDVVIDEYPGLLPGSIDQITVTLTRPDGSQSVVATYPDDPEFEFNPQWNDFFIALPGSPELGSYEARVTSGSLTATSTDLQTMVFTIPVPAISSLSPYDGLLIASKTPVFALDPVSMSVPDVPLYYRLEVVDDATGQRLWASSRILGMTAITLKVDTPGGHYRYRWRVTDSDDWEKVQNRVNSEWIQFSVATTLAAHDALPAIHPDGWNGLTWTGANAFAASVKVVDLDGVAFDGSSHTLTVTAPDGSTFPDGTHVKTAGHDGAAGPTAGYYWLYVGGGTPVSGEYTFTVTDLEGNQTRFVEQVDVNPLDGPDPASLTPSNTAHHITATFDNVYVNGSLYETFDVSDISQLDPAKWKWPSAASVENNRLKFDVSGSVGRAHGGITFTDIDPITSVRTDMTVTSVSAAASKAARISGTFFNDGSNADFWVTLWNDSSQVGYSVSKQWINHQGTYQWETVQSENLVAATVNETVTVKVTWNETTKTLTFDAHNPARLETSQKNYVHAGPVYPPISKELSLQARINLITSPTPTFSWDPVAGANRYRMRIYTHDSKTVWNGYTGSEASCTVPPGVLEPGAYYRYRVEAWDTPNPLSVDNYSRTPTDSDYYRFYTTSDVPEVPHIDLDSAGAMAINSKDQGVVPVFWVRVSDRQGVPGNIASVTVRFPSGYEEPLALDRSNGPNQGHYLSVSDQPIEDGNYTFTVTDTDGHTAMVTDNLVSNLLDYPATDSLTATVKSEEIQIGWDAVTGATSYRVDIYDDAGNRVYRFPVDATDGPSLSIPRGLLKEGQAYSYRVHAHREWLSEVTGIDDPQGNVDNCSQAPWEKWQYPTFTLIADSDGDGLSDIQERHACTDPDDADTDDDGLLDGFEDADDDGVFGIPDDETDPCDSDSDGDGIQDGTETGLPGGEIGPDTDSGVFVPDADSATTTDPRLADSDDDGLDDGEEDLNHNGRVDDGESDPNLKQVRAMPFIPLLLLGN